MTPNDTSVGNFKVSLGSHGVYGHRQTFLANTKYVFWIYYRPISHTDIRAGGVASNIGGWTEIPPIAVGNGWYRVGQYRNGTVTTDKTDNIFTSFYTPTAASGVPITIDWAAPHLLVGTTEIPDDDSFMGNNHIEDSSGYNHNGIIVGNPIISSSSARYGAYTSFDGSDDAINAGLDFEVEKTQNFTFCAWIYSDRWNTGVNDYFLSSQESGGFLIRTLSSNTIRVRVNAFTAADYSANSYIDADATLASIGITTAGWHFVAGVYTTSNLKLYVDGVLRATNTTTTYGLHFNGSTNLFLGAECAGSKPTPFCKCGLSDVRIYYTALAADDILALYHTGMKIGNKGDIHTYELNETSSQEFNARFINNSATSTTYDAKTDTYTVVSPVGTTSWGYGVRLADSPALIVPYGMEYRWTAEVWTPIALTVNTDYNNTTDSTNTNWSGNDNDATGKRLTSTTAIPANTWTRICRGSSNTHASNTSHLSIRDYSNLGLVTNGQSNPVTWKIRHLQWYLIDTSFNPKIKKTGVLEAEHFTEVEYELNKPAQFNKQMFSVNGNEFIEL